jgi:hypothetical protein
MKASKEDINSMATALYKSFPGLSWYRSKCLAKDILENANIEVQHYKPAIGATV